MDAEDELLGDAIRIGSICYPKPYPGYAPPPFYSILPHTNHKWKVRARLKSDTVKPKLKIERVFVLPHFLGLGDNGRWRWEWLPLCISLGLKVEPDRRRDCLPNFHFAPDLQLKLLTPILGKIALQPSMGMSKGCRVGIQRDFVFRERRIVAQASIEVRSTYRKSLEIPYWSIKLDWYPCTNSRVRSKLIDDALTVQYMRKFNLTQNCAIMVSATKHAFPSRQSENLLRRMNNFKVELIQTIGAMISPKKPLPSLKYLETLKNFRKFNTISIVPGHWIDPGVELGAPGERNFNLEIANIVERKLHSRNWIVLRPDRDAPSLSWEDYLDWVSKQTRKGNPVVEIHGQGSEADYRGLIYGVIGDQQFSLTKELANEFGIFEMDWGGLGVPCRGGIIIESFNTDEVSQMDLSERTTHAKKIATRIARCIEQAGLRDGAENDSSTANGYGIS